MALRFVTEQWLGIQALKLITMSRFSRRLRDFKTILRPLCTLSSAQRSPLLCSSHKLQHFTASKAAVVLKYRHLVQERSLVKNTSSRLPDELWIILLLGVGGVVLYTVTQFKKKELEIKKKESQLQLKLAEAQEAKKNNKMEEASILLKEALEVVHKEITSQTEKGPKNHKALRYIMDQLANVSFELKKWSEAEHYFRLTMQDMLSSGTPKDDDAVIEISLKLSQSCAHQKKHDLAVVGFKWCVETAEKKVQQSENPSDNSKALLGVCLDSWGTYLLSTGHSKQALEVLSRTLLISEEVLGKDHEQTSVLLNNVAKACVECGQYNEAEQFARTAVERAEERSHHQLPLFLANWGHILHLEGHVHKAKTALIRGLKLAKEANDEQLAALIESDLLKLDINIQ